ncbi:MAG: 4'-phosphopantetheinyl transferase family protein [Janibacter sp.]
MTSPDIVWHDDRLGSDDALRAHVADALDLDATQVRVGRHCKWCGSDRHGRPWARTPDGRRPHVSLARASGHLVTALDHRPVGVDLESVQSVDERWDPALVLHPTETADTPQARAALWCRKEAILKATGDGLEVAMDSLRCTDWSVEDLPAPPGLWASVATVPQAGSGGSSTS